MTPLEAYAPDGALVVLHHRPDLRPSDLMHLQRALHGVAQHCIADDDLILGQVLERLNPDVRKRTHKGLSVEQRPL